MTDTYGSDWAALFAEFHARHVDTRGKKLKFVIVFNASMEFFIGCREVPLMWRILAWIWRYSWGNNSDHCVDKIGGTAIGQQACAGAFQVDKRRINQCVGELRVLNFVHVKTGHRLKPVDDPGNVLAESPAPNGVLQGLFGAFCEEWQAEYQADFHELASAEATVARIKKVRLALFKQWKREKTSAIAMPSCVLKPTTLTAPFEDGQSGVSKPQLTDRPKPPGDAEKVHEWLLAQFGYLCPSENPGRELCLGIAAAAGDMSLDNIQVSKRDQKRIREEGLRLVLALVRQGRARWEKDSASRAEAARVSQAAEEARQRAFAAEVLKSPDANKEQLTWAHEVLDQVIGVRDEK